MKKRPAQTQETLVNACTVVGKVRDHNEDAVMAVQWPSSQPSPMGLEAVVAVADGMGGHERGEWASQTALNIFMDYLSHVPGDAQLENVAKGAFAAANQAVHDGASESDVSHPGTTLTVAMVRGNQCTVGHVGDSRLYLFREGVLRQITEDHSWSGELVRQGQMTPEQAANWAHKNQITRAIGIRSSVEIALYTIELQEEDVLLLCSDGLTGMISDEQITNIMNTALSANQAGEQLCSAANAAGGEDNISTALYAHISWPASQNLSRMFASRKQTLIGDPIFSTGLTPHALRMKMWVMFLLAIGALVVMGIGVRLVLMRSPVPTGKPSLTMPAQQNTISDTEALLRLVWEKDADMLRVSVDGASLHGISLSGNTGWDSNDCIYHFSPRESTALRNGASLELEGMQKVPVVLWTDEVWSLPVNEAGVFALKMQMQYSQDPTIIAAFRIGFDDNGREKVTAPEPTK